MNPSTSTLAVAVFLVGAAATCSAASDVTAGVNATKAAARARLDFQVTVLPALGLHDAPVGGGMVSSNVPAFALTRSGTTVWQLQPPRQRPQALQVARAAADGAMTEGWTLSSP
jgi:hypothetical protein